MYHHADSFPRGNIEKEESPGCFLEEDHGQYQMSLTKKPPKVTKGDQQKYWCHSGIFAHCLQAIHVAKNVKCMRENDKSCSRSLTLKRLCRALRGKLSGYKCLTPECSPERSFVRTLICLRLLSVSRVLYLQANGQFSLISFNPVGQFTVVEWRVRSDLECVTEAAGYALSSFHLCWDVLQAPWEHFVSPPCDFMSSFMFYHWTNE